MKCLNEQVYGVCSVHNGKCYKMIMLLLRECSRIWCAILVSLLGVLTKDHFSPVHTSSVDHSAS